VLLLLLLLLLLHAAAAGPYIKWFLEKLGHDGLNRMLGEWRASSPVGDNARDMSTHGSHSGSAHQETALTASSGREHAHEGAPPV
jgi:hypothetical protein